MNFPGMSEKIEREYDADSDGTFCSDAEMILKSRAGEVEMLTFNDGESNSETNKCSFSQEIRNNVTKTTDTQDFGEEDQSCKLISKKSVRFQIQQRKKFPKSDLMKKSAKSIKRLQLLEHHRLKMKNHGKKLIDRLHEIRNDVKLWLGGNGVQIKKKLGIALYEDVKAIKNILPQLYQASRRLKNHIGGDLPFTYKRYTMANQICETLLIQLNPETFEDNAHDFRNFNKDGFISSNEEDSDSENGQSYFSKKLLNNENKMYPSSEGCKSNHLNEREIYFKNTNLNCQLMGKNVIKVKGTVHEVSMQENNHYLNNSSEQETSGVIQNFTSSLTLNETLTFTPINESITHEKYQNTKPQNKYPKSCQYSPEVFEKHCDADVEMINLCEDDVSSSPELINIEVLKSHLNQVDDLSSVPKHSNSKEESLAHEIPLSDTDKPTESEKESRESQDQYASSQALSITSCFHRNEVNKIQARNSNQSIVKNKINKAVEEYFDDFPEDNATEIESSDNINNLIDFKTATNAKKESKNDEIYQEETESLASQNTSQTKEMRSNKMNAAEEGYRNSDLLINDELNVPSWCYVFEQLKIKNGLPTLIELMLAGMIHPGEKVLMIKGNGIKGSLLKNGKICTPEGATFQSPMAWCSAWSDGKNVSKNLAYQRVHYKGVPLLEVCQKAFEMALEELSAAKLEKQLHQTTTDAEFVTGCSATKLENDFPESCMEEFEEEELQEDLILAIEAVVLHSLEEFKVDKTFECLFSGEGKFTGDLEFIDEW